MKSLSVGFVFLFGLAFMMCTTVGAEEPTKSKVVQKQPLKEFMRGKLSSSSKILEGLAIEDFSLVLEGATELNKLSHAEKWRVLNDPMYRQFSNEFKRETSQLIESAQKQNLDKSALRWMDATMTCIECHQYVRRVLITKK